mmetsp:Transcript_12935/g.19459  ORF Transcript_12935/g.19459 Transcript_12935/m.19459 type:complete len:742 (-) Transcript_12935:228-2453(-)
MESCSDEDSVFSCSICMVEYDEVDRLPRCLPCGHTYCLQCLPRFPSSTCPECGCVFSGSKNNQEVIRCMRVWRKNASNNSSIFDPSLPPPPPPPPNPAATQTPMCEICESETAQVFCRDCPKLRSLCEECYAIRHRKPPTDSHRHIEWNADCINRVCPEHGQECLAFCKQHRVAICTLCSFSSHKGHDIGLISDESVLAVGRVQESLTKLRARTEAVKSSTKSLADTYQALTGGEVYCSGATQTGGILQASMLEIEQYFDTLRDILHTREMALKDEVRRIGELKANALVDRMEHLSVYSAKTASVVGSIEQSLATKSTLWVIENEWQMMSDIHKLLNDVDAMTTDIPSSKISFFPPADLPASLRVIGSVIDLDPAQCSVIESGPYRSHVGAQYNLTLVTRSSQGQSFQCSLLSINCTLCNQDEVEGFPVSITEQGGGLYRLSYTLNEPGRYCLHITIDGQPIAQSPLSVECTLEPCVIATHGSGPGQVSSPYGMCFYDGLLYVADNDNHRVQVLRPDGTYVRHIGSHGTRAGQFNFPRGICVADGIIFVSDNHRVQAFDIEGNLIKCIGSKGRDTGKFSYPHGLCALNGLLYCVDDDNHRIQSFQFNGTAMRTFCSKGSGPTKLSYPRGACSNGELLFVADQNNHRVQVFYGDGSFVRSIYRHSLSPYDICCSEGFLYVSDCNSHCIEVFRFDGTFVRTIGSHGQGGDQFLNPRGVCCADGMLFVSNTDNHRIHVFPASID